MSILVRETLGKIQHKAAHGNLHHAEAPEMCSQIVRLCQETAANQVFYENPDTLSGYLSGLKTVCMTQRQVRIVLGIICSFVAWFVVPLSLYGFLSLSLGVIGTSLIFWDRIYT